MTPSEIIKKLTADGVRLALNGGKLKVAGNKEVVNAAIPLLKKYKGEIIAVLAPEIPAICQKCRHLELLTIGNENVPGCVIEYPFGSEFSTEWRRFPGSMERCPGW
jgi:hypothetical protein